MTPPETDDKQSRMEIFKTGLIDRLAEKLNNTFIMNGEEAVITYINRFTAQNINWKTADIYSRLANRIDLLPEVLEIVKQLPKMHKQAVEATIARGIEFEIRGALRDDRKNRAGKKERGVEPETDVRGIMPDDDGLPRENLGNGCSRTMPVIRCKD